MERRHKRTIFRRSESGAAVVEFVIVFPFMVLIFAIIVEFGSMLWAYQSTVAGVRDASRYLARSSPVDLCVPPTGSIASQSATVRTMIEKDRSGLDVLPGSVSVNSVTVSHRCVTGTFRTSPMAIAQVTAVVDVQMPLGALFGYFGSGLSAFQTTVADEARVIGQ